MLLLTCTCMARERSVVIRNKLSWKIYVDEAKLFTTPRQKLRIMTEWRTQFWQCEALTSRLEERWIIFWLLFPICCVAPCGTATANCFFSSRDQKNQRVAGVKLSPLMIVALGWISNWTVLWQNSLCMEGAGSRHLNVTETIQNKIFCCLFHSLIARTTQGRSVLVLFCPHTLVIWEPSLLLLCSHSVGMSAGVLWCSFNCSFLSRRSV